MNSKLTTCMYNNKKVFYYNKKPLILKEFNKL